MDEKDVNTKPQLSKEIEIALRPIETTAGLSLLESGSIQSCVEEGSDIILVLETAPERAGEMEPVRHAAEQALKSAFPKKAVHVIMSASKEAPQMKASRPSEMKKPPVRENLKPPQIKHMIAVASGKGGVGKSTVAANLALALSALGLNVGLMDADIYGPSVPHIFGLSEHKAQMVEGKVQPAQAQGLTLMSIGFLVDAEQPMIWRGPMIQSAIRQFLQDVAWPELDVLVVDMPPGTGDAQLTMAQKVPLSGAVVVSTPQDIALIDARKGIEMFRQTHVPILGLVENMSGYICSNCGHHEAIFGGGTLQKDAEKYGVPMLGEIPLSLSVRLSMDDARPSDHDQIAAFSKVAEKVKTQLFGISQDTQKTLVHGTR